MDTQKYTITFELFNGEWLTREIYDGNVKIFEESDQFVSQNKDKR